MNRSTDFLPLQAVHHFDVDPEWFNRESHGNQALLFRLPLLYLHTLQRGLERRMIERVGSQEVFEAELEDVLAGTLDCDSPMFFCPWHWIENYQVIVAIVARLEWREIHQLTGRAA